MAKLPRPVPSAFITVTRSDSKNSEGEGPSKIQGVIVGRGLFKHGFEPYLD